MAIKDYLAKFRKKATNDPRGAMRASHVAAAKIEARKLAERHAEALFDNIGNEEFADSSVTSAYVDAIRSALKRLRAELIATRGRPHYRTQ